MIHFQFVFDGDEHLWVARWQNLIANRDKVSLVEICTWNDFGESHYIGPQHGNLPTGSEKWVNGFSHEGMSCSSSFPAEGGPDAAKQASSVSRTSSRRSSRLGRPPPLRRTSSSCGHGPIPRTRRPRTPLAPRRTSSSCVLFCPSPSSRYRIADCVA